MIYLRVELHAELLFHRCDNAFLQRDDFLRECLASIIHYHKRLLIPYCSTSAPTAFPSTLLNHPGCRHLDHSVRQVIVRDFEVRAMLGLGCRLNALEMLPDDDWILEETAGAAYYGRFRELILADLYDDLSDERRRQF